VDPRRRQVEDGRVDDLRVPTVARYLRDLPDGLASYPECLAKASLLHSIREQGPELDASALPSPLDELVTAPPPVSSWLPEVHTNAIMLAAFDLAFRTAGGMAAFLEWVYERNRKLLSAPLYRVLFLVVSPERLLLHMEKRWAAFHRGTDLTLIERREGHARVRLTFPSKLHCEHSARGVGAALRAAADSAGAKDCRVTVRPAEGQAEFEIDWR
jgi:hypothetical protein